MSKNKENITRDFPSLPGHQFLSLVCVDGHHEMVACLH